jgi:hypothetical protein
VYRQQSPPSVSVDAAACFAAVTMRAAVLRAGELPVRAGRAEENAVGKGGEDGARAPARAPHA